MDKQQLLSTLEKLHAELAGTDHVDENKLQQLQTITDDIQQLLTQEDDVSNAQVAPVSDSIQDLLLQFEADHPNLTLALNQVAAGLSNLGI